MKRALLGLLLWAGLCAPAIAAPTYYGNVIAPYAPTNCSGMFIVANCPPYNATGNGSTDDTAALQAAITASSAINGVVSLKPGVYKITSTLADSGASIVCQGGSYNGGSTGPGNNPACRFLWAGASGGTMMSVQPSSIGGGTLRQLLFSQLGFDGNNNAAATCLSFGASFSQIENSYMTNCSQYELLLAGPTGVVVHDRIDTFVCQNYYMSDCIHVGLFASNQGATQNSFDNLGLQFGEKGRGIVFDFVDESHVTEMSSYVVATAPVAMSTSYTASYTAATIAVSSTSQFVANTAAFINGFGFVYVNSITDATHMVVTFAGSSGVGNVAASGTTIYEYDDGVSFLAAAGYDVVDTCTGCFVHSYNQSSFQTYPVPNTAFNIDHGDNGVPLPTVESFSLLNYKSDYGIGGNLYDAHHTTCDSDTTCVRVANGVTATSAHATTSEYNVNPFGDNIRVDNGAGATGVIGLTASPNPHAGNLQIGCVAGTGCSNVQIGGPIFISDTIAHLATNSGQFDYNFTVPNDFSMSPNLHINNGILFFGPIAGTQSFAATGGYGYLVNGVTPTASGGMTFGGKTGGTSNFYAALDPNGNLGIAGQLTETPASPADNATCTAGKIWVDANYVYVCTATNTVKRTALSTY